MSNENFKYHKELIPTYKDFRDLMNQYPDHYIECVKYAWANYGRHSLPLRANYREKKIESALARSFCKDGKWLIYTFHFDQVDEHSKKISPASGTVVINIDTKKIVDFRKEEDVEWWGSLDHTV